MTSVSLSRFNSLILKYLGDMIKVARKERRISQIDLATRLNVSRYTIIAIEKGDPKVAVGSVFEAAYIVGIRLLADDQDGLQKLSRSITQFNSLLPKRIRHKNEPLDDNF